MMFTDRRDELERAEVEGIDAKYTFPSGYISDIRDLWMQIPRLLLEVSNWNGAGNRLV
jgi:hypothetical protein